MVFNEVFKKINEKSRFTTGSNIPDRVVPVDEHVRLF